MPVSSMLTSIILSLRTAVIVSVPMSGVYLTALSRRLENTCPNRSSSPNTAGSVAAAQIFGLPDGAGLQVTVFEIRSSDGKQLNRIGVVPDEVIDPNPADVATGQDPVLSRAIEILHDEGTG